MNEIQHEREQARAANLQWAYTVLRTYFDVEKDATIEQINRAAYKNTACGASVCVNDNAEIVFGSIVEGSDAEFTCDPIPTADREEDDVRIDIREALEWLEGECSAAWNDANK